MKFQFILAATALVFSCVSNAKREPQQVGNVGSALSLTLQNPCKPITFPTIATCQLTGKNYGMNISQKIVVPLKNLKGTPEADTTVNTFEANGSTDLKNGRLAIVITGETHGNNANCDLQQYLNAELTLGDDVIKMGSFGEFKTGYNSKIIKYDIKMSCTFK